MRTNILFITLFTLFLWSCESPTLRVIERPEHGLQSSKTLEIGKVELTDTATILYIDAFYRPKNWIRIDSATYIQANGEKYTVTGAKDLILHEHHWMPDSGEDHFVLFFPPLPKGTKSFDLIESDCDDCFKIWDIDLTGKKRPYASPIPKDIIQLRVDKQASLPEPELKTGKTEVRLFSYGGKPGMVFKPELSVSNIFTRERESVEGKLVGEGEYLFECDMYSTSNCYLMLGNNYISLLLAPGEKAEIYYDFTARSKRESRYHPEPDLRYAGFRGKYAQINRELNESSLMDEFRLNLNSEYRFLDCTTGEEYVSQMLSLYKEKAALLDQADVSLGLRQLVKANLKSDIIYHIISGDRFLEYLYKQANKLKNGEPVDYKAPVVTDDAFLLLKEMDALNDPRWLYSLSFTYTVIPFATGLSSDELLNEITGTTSGFLQDIRKTAPALALVTSREELQPELREALQSASTPYYSEVYDAIAERTKRQYEEALSQGGFEMLATPEVAAEKILDAILGQYKGKVVFVDFWATWCVPCLNAMKTIKPIKPEMAEKGVVSVYISNASSPQTKWISMLPDIGGLHYYLTNEQWRKLSNTHNIRSIPTYMVFDKQGKKTFETSGYPGNEKILEELAKNW